MLGFWGQCQSQLEIKSCIFISRKRYLFMSLFQSFHWLLMHFNFDCLQKYFCDNCVFSSFPSIELQQVWRRRHQSIYAEKLEAGKLQSSRCPSAVTVSVTVTVILTSGIAVSTHEVVTYETRTNWRANSVLHVASTGLKKKQNLDLKSSDTEWSPHVNHRNFVL